MKKRNTVFALVLLLLAVILGGCASDGYNTQKGAAIGAGLGAIAGQLIGHDTASTLVGAGVGTLVGAVAGTSIRNSSRQLEDSRARAWQWPPLAPRIPRAGGLKYRARGRAGNGSPHTVHGCL